MINNKERELEVIAFKLLDYKHPDIEKFSFMNSNNFEGLTIYFECGKHKENTAKAIHHIKDTRYHPLKGVDPMVILNSLEPFYELLNDVLIDEECNVMETYLEYLSKESIL